VLLLLHLVLLLQLLLQLLLLHLVLLLQLLLQLLLLHLVLLLQNKHLLMGTSLNFHHYTCLSSILDRRRSRTCKSKRCKLRRHNSLADPM
jgi:hypothetical protein